MRLILATLVFVGCVLSSYSGNADTQRVGVPALDGLVVIGEEKAPKGTISKMLTSTGKGLGIDIKISVHPLARLLKELEHGSIDIGLFIRSKKRDRLFALLLHIGNSQALAVALLPR